MDSRFFFFLSEHLPICVHPSVCLFCVCLSVPRYYSGTPKQLILDPAPSRIVAICHKAGRNIEAREEPLLLTHRHPHPRTSLQPTHHPYPPLPPSLPHSLPHPPTHPTPSPSFSLPLQKVSCIDFWIFFSLSPPLALTPLPPAFLLIMRAIMMPAVIGALPTARLRSDEDPTRGSMDTYRCLTLMPTRKRRTRTQLSYLF